MLQFLQAGDLQEGLGKIWKENISIDCKKWVSMREFVMIGLRIHKQIIVNATWNSGSVNHGDNDGDDDDDDVTCNLLAGDLQEGLGANRNTILVRILEYTYLK